MNYLLSLIDLILVIGRFGQHLQSGTFFLLSGLVGGHCIGVDPHYLTYKAMEVGYHPEIILAGRKLNDNMGVFISKKLFQS